MIHYDIDILYYYIIFDSILAICNPIYYDILYYDMIAINYNIL